MTTFAPQAAKDALQGKIDPARHSMLADDVAAESGVVQSAVLKAEWFKNSARICVYVSACDEIATDGIILTALSQNKIVYIPYVKRGTQNMQMLRLNNAEEFHCLKPEMCGFRQFHDTQGHENVLDTEALDLVILPGVAFSLDGNRLGHRKDSYYRFLDDHRKHFGGLPHTVGLALSVQVTSDLPLGPNEVHVDHVLSVVNCS